MQKLSTSLTNLFKQCIYTKLNLEQRVLPFHKVLFYINAYGDLLTLTNESLLRYSDEKTLLQLREKGFIFRDYIFRLSEQDILSITEAPINPEID